MYVEILGWLSSIILLLTISKQIHAQWKKGTSQGVSRWLFLGQLTASTGFLAYSIMLKSTVFIVTNALMMVSAIVGYLLVLAHRYRSRREGAQQVGEAREAGPLGSSPVLARSSAI